MIVPPVPVFVGQSAKLVPVVTMLTTSNLVASYCIKMLTPLIACGLVTFTAVVKLVVKPLLTSILLELGVNVKLAFKVAACEKTSSVAPITANAAIIISEYVLVLCNFFICFFIILSNYLVLRANLRNQLFHRFRPNRPELAFYLMYSSY